MSISQWFLSARKCHETLNAYFQHLFEISTARCQIELYETNQLMCHSVSPRLFLLRRAGIDRKFLLASFNLPSLIISLSILKGYLNTDPANDGNLSLMMIFICSHLSLLRLYKTFLGYCSSPQHSFKSNSVF